jgi:hypothetical protein
MQTYETTREPEPIGSKPAREAVTRGAEPTVVGVPAAALNATSLMRLQRLAGNAGVASLLAQRAPDTAAPTTAPTPAPGTAPGTAPATPAPPDPAKLSGAQWKAKADANWADSKSLDDLNSGFKASMDKFLAMLTANNITTGEYTTKRPAERAYLLHYSVEVKNGTTAPKDVPKQDGVDIIWDHGDDAKSKTAAGEMADAFGIVGPAALISNHIAGNAIDMKFDFTKMTKDKDGNYTITYKLGEKDVSRKLQIDDEAVLGVAAKGKTIASIGDRELSKAGEDFGVKRHIDNDIVHWSTTGN